MIFDFENIIKAASVPIAIVVASIKIYDILLKRNINIRSEKIKDYEFITKFSKQLFSGELTMIERDYGCAIIQKKLSRSMVEYVLRFKEPRAPLVFCLKYWNIWTILRIK